MYGTETIKQMNAESSLKWPEEMNMAMVMIKEALRQVAQVDVELENARQLKASRHELARQFELAEAFYVAERKRLLDLEDLILRLGTISEDLASLFELYDCERLTLQGRSLIVEQSGINNVDTASIREEVRFMLPQLTQRCEKVAVTMQEINQVLHEYSCALESDQAHGTKRKGTSLTKPLRTQ